MDSGSSDNENMPDVNAGRRERKAAEFESSAGRGDDYEQTAMILSPAPTNKFQIVETGSDGAIIGLADGKAAGEEVQISISVDENAVLTELDLSSLTEGGMNIAIPIHACEGQEEEEDIENLEYLNLDEQPKFADPLSAQDDAIDLVDATDLTQPMKQYLDGELSFSNYLALIESEDEEEGSSSSSNRKVLPSTHASSTLAGNDESSSEESGTDDPDYEPPQKSNQKKIAKKRVEARHSSSSLCSSSDYADESDWHPEAKQKRPDTTKLSEKDASYQESAAKPRKERAKPMKRLPPALQGLMGEANLRFARGERQDAINMCMEVIRQAPTFPEAFRTLSMIHEEMGDTAKAHQFALIAAHLDPHDAEEWTRLAEVSFEQGDLLQAEKCYKKAVEAAPDNLELHHIRIGLLEKLGDKRRLLLGCLRLLQAMKGEHAAECLQMAKEIARTFHSQNDTLNARKAMQSALNNASHLYTPEDYNLLLELMLQLKEFDKCVTVLTKHGGVQLLSKQDLIGPQEEQLKQAYEITCPTHLPLDLKTKLVVALIQLGAYHLIQNLLKELQQADVEQYGDLYLDVAEAFMEKTQMSDALVVLEKLVNSTNYSLAAVWLRYAECLVGLQEWDRCLMAYKKVIELAPQHFEARLALATLLQDLGRPEEAASVLAQEANELLDARVLYQRCRLLQEQGKEDELVETSKWLFARHFAVLRNINDAYAITKSKRTAHVKSSDTSGDPVPTFSDSEVSLEDEYALFRHVANILWQKKRYVELQRLCISALGSRLYQNSERLKDIGWLTFQVCLKRNEANFGYSFIRRRTMTDFNNNRVWVLFNQLLLRSDDVRHNRFLIRLMVKHPDSFVLTVLNGHNCLLAGTYKYALAEYLAALRLEPENPMIPFLVGLVYTHMACQKFSGKKHALVLQASAFLERYAELRGEEQETNYNLGRAMHQLGLYTQAIHYYKRALALPNPVNGPDEHLFDLRREIAFNLALIYQSSGALEMATLYLYKHNVV